MSHVVIHHLLWHTCYGLPNHGSLFVFPFLVNKQFCSQTFFFSLQSFFLKHKPLQLCQVGVTQNQEIVPDLRHNGIDPAQEAIGVTTRRDAVGIRTIPRLTTMIPRLTTIHRDGMRNGLLPSSHQVQACLCTSPGVENLMIPGSHHSTIIPAFHLISIQMIVTLMSL